MIGFQRANCGVLSRRVKRLYRKSFMPAKRHTTGTQMVKMIHFILIKIRRGLIVNDDLRPVQETNSTNILHTGVCA